MTDYPPAILAAAYRTTAAIDPNDPDLQSLAPVIGKLTERECEILQCLANDCTPEEIAGTLVISCHTVRSHIENICSKLRVRYTASAVAGAAHYNTGTGIYTVPATGVYHLAGGVSRQRWQRRQHLDWDRD